MGTERCGVCGGLKRVGMETTAQANVSKSDKIGLVVLERAHIAS